jgi:hypothetical protein
MHMSLFGPFVKLRWDFIELTYRGLLGLHDNENWNLGGSPTVFGWNDHQLMTGLYFSKHKKESKQNAGTMGYGNNETNFKSQAKNALLLDFAPFIYSLYSRIGIDRYESFGVGMQYERKQSDYYSLMGRFDWFGYKYCGFYDWGMDTLSTTIISLETHARYYPSGLTFFLDAMLGYIIDISDYGNGDYTESYFKQGASFGWRIRFGKDSGFTWELSLGWNFALLRGYCVAFDDGAHLLGGAGPRLVSALGWRF